MLVLLFVCCVVSGHLSVRDRGSGSGSGSGIVSGSGSVVVVLVLVFRGAWFVFSV